MKTSAICFALAVLVAVAACSVHLPKEPLHFSHPMVEARWNDFLSLHNVSYSTPQEYRMRRGIFRDNLIRAAQMNAAARGKTHFGITRFSDMTPEEFKSQVLMNSPPAVDYDTLKAHEIEVPKVAGAPETKNWAQEGATTPVYNQGQCGSCWAFSATEQTESMFYLQHGKLNSLSMQQVVSCDTQAYGCGGGWTYSAYEYVMGAGGYDSYSSYPYTAANTQCNFHPSDVVVKVTSWSYITQNADEAKMKDYIASTGPLSICADASSWQFYNGGVLMGSNCGSSIDHCIQLVGYDMSASTPYWIVRNSWGPSWGENGMIYLEYGQNTCAMGNVVTTCQTAAA